jgi:hypothetical protein
MPSFVTQYNTFFNGQSTSNVIIDINKVAAHSQWDASGTLALRLQESPIVSAASDETSFASFTQIQKGLALASGSGYAYDNVNPFSGLALNVAKSSQDVDSPLEPVSLTPSEDVLQSAAKTCNQAFAAISVVDSASSLSIVVLKLSRFLFAQTMANGASIVQAQAYWNDTHMDLVTPLLNQFLNEAAARGAPMPLYSEWCESWRTMFSKLPSNTVIANQVKASGSMLSKRLDLLTELLFVTHAPYMLFSYMSLAKSRARADFYEVRLSEMGMWLFFTQLFAQLYGPSKNCPAILSSFNDILSQCASALDESRNTFSSMGDIRAMAKKNRETVADVAQKGAALENDQNRLLTARGLVDAAERRRRSAMAIMIVWAIVCGAFAASATFMVIKGKDKEAIIISSVALAFLLVVAVIPSST